MAAALERRLIGLGLPAYVLDGDNLRHGLCSDLGFDRASRAENVRRAAEVACLLADAGVVALVPLISPYRADRELARQRHLEAGLDLLEVWVSTPLEECERRDAKGLYAAARAGELTGFTGIDDPYEPPEAADLEVAFTGTPAEMAADTVLAKLRELGLLAPTGRG